MTQFKNYDEYISDLESKLEGSSTEERVSVLNEISFGNRLFRTTKSFHFAQEALDLALNINNVSEQIKALLNLAFANLQFCKYKDCQNHLNQAKRTISPLKHHESYSYLLDIEAQLYYLWSDYEQGLLIALDLLDYSNKHGFVRNEGMAYLHLGRLFNKTNEYNKSEEYLELAKAKFIDAPYKIGEGFVAMARAEAFKSQKEYDKAESLLLECINTSTKCERDSITAELQMELGHTQVLNGNYTGQESITKGIEKSKTIDHHYLHAKGLHYLSICQAANDAVGSLTQALEIAYKINTKKLVCELLYDLSLREEERKNFTIALKFSRQYHTIKMAMQDEIYQTKISSLNIRYSKSKNKQIIYSNSSKFQNIIKEVELVSPTTATVLITGESGTGKELIANMIHQSSDRSSEPFVKVNCASIPAQLMESEFFGHYKGAFTGALQNRKGKFELAHKGTLFLDEVGELPLDLQAKLLRALQEGEIEPIGSNEVKKVDVRIIAATNRDLEAMSLNAEFRFDLYYRLNVFPVHLLPLRERKEDIELLTQHFVDFYSAKFKKNIKRVDEKSKQELQNYHWPGNIRELQNVIERATIIAQGGILKTEDTFFKKSMNSNYLPKNIPMSSNPNSESIKDQIIDALNLCNWKIEGKEGAAAMLNLPPSTLRSRMKKWNIERPD